MREFKDWVNKSYKLPGVKDNPFIVMDFQALGRLDGELTEASQSGNEIISNPISESDNMHNLAASLNMQRLWDYSRLWILAAYEVTRVLAQIDSAKYGNIKKQLAQVRIPMAKYEKAGTGRNPKYDRAHPAIQRDNGDIGWVMTDGYFITREKLAQELFDAIG